MAAVALLDPAAPEFHMPSSKFDPEAPSFTPLSQSQMRSDAAEFIPTYGGLATLQKVAEAYQQKQKRQMPPATDEEWETRIAKREKEVETIKSLQSYRLYLEVFPPEKRGDDDPKTPDPRDRTVSKRMWKWNVEKWRLQLKSRCVYSRAVALQCREYVLRQEREEREVAASTSSASGARAGGGATSAQGSCSKRAGGTGGRSGEETGSSGGATASAATADEVPSAAADLGRLRTAPLAAPSAQPLASSCESSPALAASLAAPSSGEVDWETWHAQIQEMVDRRRGRGATGRSSAPRTVGSGGTGGGSTGW